MAETRPDISNAAGQFPFELLVRDSMCLCEHATAAHPNTKIRLDNAESGPSERESSSIRDKVPRCFGDRRLTSGRSLEFL